MGILSFAANYDDVLAQLRGAGLLLDGPALPLSVDTRKSVRCRVEGEGKEKKGWYWLHSVQIDGTYYLIGSYGVFSGRDPGTQKIELMRQCDKCRADVPFRDKVCPACGSKKTHKKEISKEQAAAMKARLAEQRKRAEAERAAEAAKAAAVAQSAWMKCDSTWTPQGGAETDTCSYLQRKGVKAHGVRFTEKGALVVPMMDTAGRVHGLQFILSKDTHAERIKKTGRDKEYWPTGLVKQGHFFLIGSPDIAGICLVAEGYATGASLHEATQLPVAVAFDAGNLMPVGEALRKRYKRARLLFCADDDAYGKCPDCKKLTPQPAPTCAHCGADTTKLQNAGVTAAQLAALAIPNSAWTAPTFANTEARRVAAMERGEKTTDYNDLHKVESLTSVTSQIEAKLRELGWNASAAATSTRHPGEVGESELPTHWTLDTLLPSYALIYGTETVFDGRLRRIIGLGSLRAAAGKSLVRMWLEHPGRRTVLPEQVGFDPTERNAEIKCNLWGGWPTTPKRGSCALLFELLEYLCGNEDDPRAVYQWILHWLAYPIQNPGAKMQTAILMHGPEGSGKNTFFGVVRRLYGRYGGIFSQTELESQFNGWASGRLFMIGNEVVTRVELYHQQGRLKNMVTEGEWQVNEKNLPARMEANHCNFVFFSNRIDIAKLDREDRRYCVVWTPTACREDFYKEVAHEIENGGVEALHEHLATLDLGDFNAHTKPPLTRSKRELIDLGMDSTERFWLQWTGGELDVPCCPCTSRDLYQAYQQWGKAEGVPKLAQLNTLIGTLGKKPGVSHGPMEHFKTTNCRPSEKTKTRLFVPPTTHTPPNLKQGDTETKTQWLTGCIVTFRNALEGIAQDD